MKICYHKFEVLKNIYQLVAENLKRARAKLGSKEYLQPSKLRPETPY